MCAAGEGFCVRGACNYLDFNIVFFYNLNSKICVADGKS